MSKKKAMWFGNNRDYLDPFAHYTFEEQSGLTSVDVSGNGRDLTLSLDTMWSEQYGKKGIDGGNTTSKFAEMTIADSNLLINNNAYTLSCWCDNSTGNIWEKGQPTGNRVVNVAHSGSFVRVWIGNSSGTWEESAITPVSVWGNERKHYAITINITEMKIYVNGLLEYTANYSAGSFVQTAFPLYIIGKLFSTQAFIDNVLLYDRVLTIEEVNKVIAATQ